MGGYYLPEAQLVEFQPLQQHYGLFSQRVQGEMRRDSLLSQARNTQVSSWRRRGAFMGMNRAVPCCSSPYPMPRAPQAFWVLLYTVFNACPFEERDRGVLSDIVINKPLAQWSCLSGLSSSSCLFTHRQTHTHTYTHLNNFCRLELHHSLCPCILSSNVYDPFSKACAGI